MNTTNDTGYDRLESQISWYDKKSNDHQFWFKRLKYTGVIFAALVPVSTSTNFIPPWITGSLGALVVIIEGFQQINQHHHNWVTYRSTCEALKHEKYLFLARSDIYDLPEEEAQKLLAQRVESLISTEHSKWIAKREKQIDEKHS